MIENILEKEKKIKMKLFPKNMLDFCFITAISKVM